MPHALVPVGQLSWHVPAEHFSPALHVLLQAPQWMGLVWMLVHFPPQADKPGGQIHFPLLQVCPVRHFLAQAPQLLKSVVVSKH